MQSQGTTSKGAVKVPKRQALRVERKKIKDALNMLIRVLKESKHIWNVFLIILYGLYAKLFIFLLLYLILFIFFNLFLFRFVSISIFRCDLN